MIKRNKAIIAAIVLLFVFTIGSVIAYFTDIKTVTNTFTIGNVKITLTEPHWSLTDENSNDVPDAAENKAPGESILKDPTITNTGTNNAFIFAKVEIACTTDAAPSTPKEIFTYSVNSGWYLMTNGSCTNGKATKIYAYGSSSAMSAVTPNGTAILFNSVTVNTQLTGAETGLTGNKTIDVTAYAIQSDGIGNIVEPSAVWTLANFNYS